MSGINTGAFPAGAGQDWASVETLAIGLNTELTTLDEDVDTLELQTLAIVDNYNTIIETGTLLTAEAGLYNNPFERFAITSNNLVSGTEYTICNFQYAFAPNPTSSGLPVAFVGAYLSFTTDGVFDITKIIINLNEVQTTKLLEQDTTWSAVQNNGLITANFASVIINKNATTQNYTLSVLVTSSGNYNIVANSYAWLMPMTAPIVPA